MAKVKLQWGLGLLVILALLAVCFAEEAETQQDADEESVDAETQRFRSQCQKTLLKNFAAGDNAADSTVAAWLVADLSRMVQTETPITPAQRSVIEQGIRDKWTRWGAKRITIRPTSINAHTNAPDVDGPYGATFVVKRITYVIFTWVLPPQFNGNALQRTVPYPNQANARVTESFWNFYQSAPVRQIFTDARALGNNVFVLAGLSAGAAAAQFGALDLEGVRGVYLFGAERFGNQAFQDFYVGRRGAQTRSWWNKFDVWPLTNPTTTAESNLVSVATLGGQSQCANFRVIPDVVSLPNNVRWRVGPNDDQCQKLTATLATPCAGAASCAGRLNCDDHEPRAYFDSIKLCAATARCINELVLG